MADESDRYLEEEEAKTRCRHFIDDVRRFPSSIPNSCRRTLLRLAQAELSFLSRRAPSSSDVPLSVNIGHLEAVLHILRQPFINGVSRVCKPIPRAAVIKGDEKNNLGFNSIHVDIVCSVKGKPVWVIVSDRNPKYLSWKEYNRTKGLKSRVEKVLEAARSLVALRPSSVILFFAKGIDGSLLQDIENGFGASKFELEIPDFYFTEEGDGNWINIIARSYSESVALEIKVDHREHPTSASESGLRGLTLSSEATDLLEEKCSLDPHGAFNAIISGLKPLIEINGMGTADSGDVLHGGNLINFDTTALIALVSEISNDGAEKLLSKSEEELRLRFKGNVEFVIRQAESELHNPIHVELGSATSLKRGIVCETVLYEFKELISMCGGTKEKWRANQLLKRLVVVPDHPSDRMASIPNTRKLDLKNKTVFGTGDYWQAPTLTANMAFIRAISQIGMSLHTINHQPRALTGD
ncbi:hypothetical protein SAY86_005510 [Trapa natans]|uniref:DUF1308 domain-containing protein n=1 Tax=Trapa natans TaxID=22666 RepID=A0AAN7QSJ7_TRANT|nr:hypothetical protein SAY86_005510 [Trapa natans]